MSKLNAKRYGPFKILDAISPIVYRLQLPVTWKIHDVFHPSLLSPYHESLAHGTNFSRPPPDIIDGEEEQEIERILGYRQFGRQRKPQYLVKWKGFPDSDNEWVALEHMHAPELIKAYHRKTPSVAIKGALLPSLSQQYHPVSCHPTQSESVDLSNEISRLEATQVHKQVEQLE